MTAYEPMDAIYVRQSLDKKDSVSIENQIQFCVYETKGRRYQTYIDRGYSGKTTRRPAFSAMIEDMKAGKIGRIIVYKLDRISRSILDFTNMMELFRRYQVEFISSTEKFDTSTPIGNAMLNLAVVFAQLERETIQRRIADAYVTRSQMGYFMGGSIPYGYRLLPGSENAHHTSMLVCDDYEAGEVRFIYNAYFAGNSLQEIVELLLSHGNRKKRQATWYRARISEILRNPLYVKTDDRICRHFEQQGIPVSNQTLAGSKTHGIFLYHRPWQKTEAVIGIHEGIIPPDLWLPCQRKQT